MTGERAIPGIDAPRVGEWLSRHVPGVRPPFAFRLISGGRSNLTFGVTDAAGRVLVLRRPPLGHVLPSAHDMAREHRIVSALAPTAVPVPTAHGLCEDPAVNGAPFYVMDFVDGLIVRDEADAARELPEAVRPAVTDAVVDVLAELHALEPEDVGLGTLGRREGYVERQLRRWQRQWESARTRDVPVVDEVHRRLAARVPEQQGVAIVHGDYRIDNLALRRDGSVAAVLDWELCTLGDPLADVGLLLVYWAQDGEDVRHMLSGTPTVLPGFGDRRALLARYAERTHADVSGMAFYVALGLWKLACIAEGIYARYREGAMGGDEGVRPGDMAAKVPVLAERALATLEGEG